VPHTFPLRPPLWLALSLLGLTACNNAPSQQTPPAPRPALVITAGSMTQQGQAYIAEVRAISRAELAFAVSGRVIRLHADVGDSVRAGQLLAELDTTPLRAQLLAAGSDEAAARVRWQEVHQRHARIQAAQQGQAISAGEMEAVKAELDAAAATLAAASAQRSQAEWALAQASLRAPVDGVIGSRQLAVGQSAGPGASVFSIEGSGRELALWLPANVKLATGQSVALQHCYELPPRWAPAANARYSSAHQRKRNRGIPGKCCWAAVALPASAFRCAPCCRAKTHTTATYCAWLPTAIRWKKWPWLPKVCRTTASALPAG